MDSQRQNADSRPRLPLRARPGARGAKGSPHLLPGLVSFCPAGAALVCSSPQPLLYAQLNLLLSLVRTRIPEGPEQLIQATGVWVTGATPLPQPQEGFQEALCSGELPGGQGFGSQPEPHVPCTLCREGRGQGLEEGGMEDQQGHVGSQQCGPISAPTPQMPRTLAEVPATGAMRKETEGRAGAGAGPGALVGQQV